MLQNNHPHCAQGIIARISKTLLLSAFVLGLLGMEAIPAAAVEAPLPPSQMERLGRGLVVTRLESNKAFASWRLLGTDDPAVAFNIYRATGNGAPVKLNAKPIIDSTCFTDTKADFSKDNVYSVRTVVSGIEQTASAAASTSALTLRANTSVQSYLRLPLQRPADVTTPDGVASRYSPNEASVGDLDGDGEYEIILKWKPENARDNAQFGYTANTYLDAYKLDGTLLWRIDLGINIRSGSHYTQFMVYDFDGDGKAEVVCKTADGTIDGAGKVIGNLNADHRIREGRTTGRILSGPEYLTVFDGMTGAAIDTVQYLPQRDPDNHDDNPAVARQKEIWGDDYGNRMDRFLATVAYLDGQRPSIVMSRGYYKGRTVLVAWDFREGKLRHRWTFDSSNPGNEAYNGQGFHNLSAADVDGDGKDEIIFGSCVINHDGTGRFSTGNGHGDAIHVAKMIPGRSGLQVWTCLETRPFGHDLYDSSTGESLLRITGTSDTGRATAGHIDARYPGYQVWGVAADVTDATTKKVIGKKDGKMLSFMLWWDGDLQREITDGKAVYKWTGAGITPILADKGVVKSNGTKSTPVLSGDLFGDWREEIIMPEYDCTHRNKSCDCEYKANALRIYTTPFPTSYRFPTLMHDRQYRVSIAWQNVAYNQPPHLSYYLGAGMKPAPWPNIVTPTPGLSGK